MKSQDTGTLYERAVFLCAKVQHRHYFGTYKLQFLCKDTKLPHFFPSDNSSGHLSSHITSLVWLLLASVFLQFHSTHFFFLLPLSHSLFKDVHPAELSHQLWYLHLTNMTHALNLDCFPFALLNVNIYCLYTNIYTFLLISFLDKRCQKMSIYKEGLGCEGNGSQFMLNKITSGLSTYCM